MIYLVSVAQSLQFVEAFGDRLHLLPWTILDDLQLLAVCDQVLAQLVWLYLLAISHRFGEQLVAARRIVAPTINLLFQTQPIQFRVQARLALN